MGKYPQASAEEEEESITSGEEGKRDIFLACYWLILTLKKYLSLAKTEAGSRQELGEESIWRFSDGKFASNIKHTQCYL